MVTQSCFLLEDMQTAWLQLRRGEAISLPGRTASYAEWAAMLENHARTGTLLEEAAYWLGASGREDAALPVDFLHGPNTEASALIR